MPKTLSKLMYGTTPGRFASPLPVPEAVARLAKIAQPRPIWGITHEHAFGSVSVERVAIRRIRPVMSPFAGTLFKPLFIGTFRSVPSGSELVGQFTMGNGSQMLITFGFGFVVLWMLLALISGVIHGGYQWLWALGGVPMLGVGFLVVQAGQSFGEGDVPWLSNVIADALDATIDVE